MYVRGYPWREREASYLAGYPDIELPAVTEAEVVSSGAPGLPGGSWRFRRRMEGGHWPRRAIGMLPRAVRLSPCSYGLPR